MQFDNFTIKSREVIQRAQNIAQGHGHQSIENGHLVKALIETDDNVLPFILKKQGIQIDGVSQAIDRIIESYPKVSGGQLYISQTANQTLITAEKTVVEEIELIFQGGVPIDKKGAVARVIMIPVEVAELFIAEIGDNTGVSTRLVGIGGSGHQAAEDMMEYESDRIREGALHFIEHHTLKLQRTLEAFFVVMPALLFEGFGIKQRIKNHVAIDIHQVEVFFQIACGEGIVSNIRPGHGVEKGHQSTFIHFPKHVFDRIFLRPHQYRMLENMGHSCGVGRGSIESCRKGLVGVAVFYGDQRAAKRLVFEQVNIRAYLFDVFVVFQLEAGDGCCQSVLHVCLLRFVG